MNKKERKERLKDIIFTCKDTLSVVEDKLSEYDELMEQYQNFYGKLEDRCYTDALEVDYDNFSDGLVKAMLDETEFERLNDELGDFLSDLEDYMSELSESKREALEDYYSELENIKENLVIDDGMTMHDIHDNLKEKLEILEGM